MGAIRTTLPVTACICCYHGIISNTVQSYNIITTYPNITILKNVKRVKIVVLRQKTDQNGIHQKTL